MKLIDRDKEREDRLLFIDVRGPTNRRLSHDDHVVGGDERTGPRITMISPLERLFQTLFSRVREDSTEQKRLSRSYQGLDKFRRYWRGCAFPGVRSPDMDRLFASDGFFTNLPRSEWHAHCRKQYAAGKAELGHRVGIVVQNLVISETTLEVAGYAIGYRNKPQAIAGATELVVEGGTKLAKLWGVG